jgi:TetR/AcrR family transcriptional regulator
MARIAKNEREEFLSATRQHLVDAALAEFASLGYANANINTISQNAGFSKGTVYNYFASKEALMLALIAETGARHLAYIRERMSEENDPLQRLNRFYEAGFCFVEEHPVQARFLITTLYSPELRFQEAMHQAYLPMFRLVAQEILTPGVARGIFHAENVVATASMLMTIYLGTSSNVDAQGKVYMDSHQVANFVLRSLRQA